MMRYRIARALQLIGLILLPIAMAGNLAQIPNADVQLDLKQMFLVAGIGIGLFYLGQMMLPKK